MRQRSLARRTRSARGVVSGRVESQYFVGSASHGGHSISNHSSGRDSARCSSRWAGRTRSRVKRERIAPRVPSRHVTVRHAVVGSATASRLRLWGACVAVRRTHVGGRPRPFHRFGGRGAAPGRHAVVSFFTPTTYASPAVVSASRNAVVSP